MAKIISVKIEYRTNPIGIETQRPRFSWEYSQEIYLMQKYYRVLVASKPEYLTVELADKWDSGQVKSSVSLNIEYKGKPLKSCELCYVKVLTQTTCGNIESDIHTFEMGLFEKDWNISWRTCPLTATGAAIAFRKNIVLPADKKVERARAYVCGLGYHEFYVNGVKIGDGVLNPVVSDYDKIVYYNIYDITEHLNEKNAIGILAGGGWRGQPQVAANVYVKFTDGSEKLIITKEYERFWRARVSPIISNTLFDGETYDARIEDSLKGWCEYNEKFGLDNGWYFAVPRKHHPETKVRAQSMQEIKVQEVVNCVNQYTVEGATIYDFGKILTGWETLKIKGECGAKITLRFSEMVDEKGKLNRKSLRNALNTDTYILSGKGIEEYKPRFSYRGFRYAEATIEGNAEILEIKAEILRTDSRQTGFFNCSDEYLNKLHMLSLNTESCNHHSILTDCPQRDERMGWLNDLASRLYQTVNNFGMELFFDKITEDINETMDENGAIKDTAPYYLGGNIADPVSVAYLLIGEFANQHYCDKQIISNNYLNYKKWVDFLTSKLKDGLLPIGIYGDWVPAISVVPYISRRFNKGFPIELISSMYLFWHYKIFANFARILKKYADAKKYEELAQNTKNSINDAYYDREKACYCADVQSGNSVALSLGIVEDDQKQKVFDAIVKDLEQRNYKMTCGNQGYRHLIEALSIFNRNDLVLKLLKNKEYPGWGYMIECGATTIWERWEDEISTTEENMHSYCHPMFGSYDYWFYQHLAGIRVQGFSKNAYRFVIKPCVSLDIEKVQCSYQSLCGEIAVNYEIKEGMVKYTIKIPSNTIADVYLKKGKKSLKSGLYEFTEKI